LPSTNFDLGDLWSFASKMMAYDGFIMNHTSSLPKRTSSVEVPKRLSNTHGDATKKKPNTSASSARMGIQL